jgi:hypothetical protein
MALGALACCALRFICFASFENSSFLLNFCAMTTYFASSSTSSS